ncbi:MAG: hypothetical protein J6V50_05715 [Clostridia bacterium]|nr:hypothetical protein [Clostridia bacterium]
MENMSPHDFERMKNEAAERMKKMTRRDMPPFPNFVKIPDNEIKESNITPPAPPPKAEPIKLSAKDKQYKSRIGNFLKYVNIPEMLENRDAMLLLALIILLSNEDADETLILALAYILL